MSPAPSAPAANQTEVEMWRKIEGPATKRRRLRVSPDTSPGDQPRQPSCELVRGNCQELWIGR
jgi:hypothetical protein